MKYLSVARMAPTVFNSFTFRFTRKFFVARKFLLFHAAAAPPRPHLPTLWCQNENEM